MEDFLAAMFRISQKIYYVTTLQMLPGVQAYQAEIYENRADIMLTSLAVMLISFLFIFKKFRIASKPKYNPKERTAYRKYYRSCVQPEYWVTNNFVTDSKRHKIEFSDRGSYLAPLFSKMSKEDFASYIKLNCDCVKEEEAGIIVTPIPSFKNPLKIINYHNCGLTNATALKRSAALVPTVDNKVLSEFKNFLQEEVYPEFDKVAESFVYSFDIWWNHISVSQRNEVQNELNKPRNWLNKQQIIREIVGYNNFVKSEDQTQGPQDSKTRNICNVSAFRKMLAGPVIYMLEKMVKINPFFEGYMSGLNYDDKGKYLQNISEALGTDCIKLDGDGKAFDSTQHIEIKRLVDDYLYGAVIKKMKSSGRSHNFPLFAIKAALMNHQAKIKMIKREGNRMRTLVTLTHEGTVHTGDMDTSLGNTLRMWCYIRFIEKMVGIPLIGNKVSKRQVAGDDNSLYVNKRFYEIHEQKIIAAYAKVFTTKMTGIKHGLGQVIKFLKKGTISQGDFCSTNCFPVTREGRKSFRVIRIPARVLSTYAYMGKTHLTPSEWLYATGECEMYWSKGLPIFEKLAQYKLRHGVPCSKMHKKESNSDKFPRRVLTPDEEQLVEKYSIQFLKDKIHSNYFNRDLFYKGSNYQSSIEDTDYEDCVTWLRRNFSISREEIDDFHNYLDNLDIEESEMNHPVIQKLESPRNQEDLTKRFSC